MYVEHDVGTNSHSVLARSGSEQVADVDASRDPNNKTRDAPSASSCIFIPLAPTNVLRKVLRWRNDRKRRPSTRRRTPKFNNAVLKLSPCRTSSLSVNYGAYSGVMYPQDETNCSVVTGGGK
ncbi:hypothetical protein CBL_03170 [Carabus blaptoides fortunei]